MSEDVPGINDKFRVPRNYNDQQLLNAARAFARDAAPHSAQFIAHELPVDFLEDLNADIDAMEAAISEQSGTGQSSGRERRDRHAIDRGVDVVRKLDAIVKNKYANNLLPWRNGPAPAIPNAPLDAPPVPEPHLPVRLLGVRRRKVRHLRVRPCPDHHRHSHRPQA